MRKFLAFLRSIMVPAILVGLAALLTVPWATWVILAAYQRDVNEKVQLLAQRVRLEFTSSRYRYEPQMVIDSLRTELLGDPTVQGVCFLSDDPYRYSGAAVSRNDSIPLPRTMSDIDRLLKTPAPDSDRRALRWSQKNGVRGAIYIDLSVTELKKRFWQAYWPLLRNVILVTATGFMIISSMCLYAYHLWMRAARQQERAQLAQQGLLAERVLTAAVLAHEIRNPLAALRFQLHSLRRNSADATRVSSTADTIDNELMRIQRLVQDYLAHEKAQAMRVEPVDLSQAVRDLHTLMAELLRESGTRMYVHERAGPVVVACDPAGLRQVLMNLVINAQQAMGHGGVINITIDQEAGFGKIAVSDTGPGIPPEMQDRLFKPFATSKKEGSGIGLALVKRFVDNFGGSVSVESTPNLGATFHLRLPLMGTAQALVPQYRAPLTSDTPAS